MAHRLLRGIVKETPKQIEQFKHLLVLDLEATCMKDYLLKPQEIIELPCIALSTKNWEVESVFHEYIKPRVHPRLTYHCIALTGIMQEAVDESDHFPESFRRFRSWLEPYSKNGAFVTCGDWDFRVMLPAQCSLDGIELPTEFQQWIDLKRIFCDTIGYFPRSLRDMLMRLKLPMEGKLHSGIDDATNMVRIMKVLASHNANFHLTSKLTGNFSNTSRKVSSAA